MYNFETGTEYNGIKQWEGTNAGFPAREACVCALSLGESGAGGVFGVFGNHRHRYAVPPRRGDTAYLMLVSALGS